MIMETRMMWYHNRTYRLCYKVIGGSVTSGLIAIGLRRIVREYAR